VSDRTGTIPTRPHTPPCGGSSPRRGRHAKLPARTSWVNRSAAPLFQERKRLILGAVVTSVVVALGISLTGWGDPPPGKPCALSYAGKQGSDVCADSSGTVTTGDLTVNATPLATAGPRSGSLSLCSKVTLTNNGDDTQDYHAADFKIQNPSGEMNSPTSGTLHTAAALAAGGTETGTICDDRALWSGQYAVIYEPSVGGSRRDVWLTQH
jgi:hypothetical protein